MTRPSPPDSTTAVFSGPSLREALGAARAAHGPDVPVLRALRVRQGMRGLLGHVRYDVHVRVPATATAPAGDRPAAGPRPVGRPAAAGQRHADRDGGAGPEDVLRHLVESADEVEGAMTPSWSWRGQEDVTALLDDIVGLTATADTSPAHPAPGLARHTGPTAGPGAPTRSAPTRSTPTRSASPSPRRPTGPVDPVPASRPGDEAAYQVRARLRVSAEELLVDAVRLPGAPEDDPRPAPGVPDWDRAELRSLGIPAAVLRRLPAEDPADDAGWRRALVTAIATVLPAPTEPGETTPVVVSGHGATGVVAVLRAAVDGGASPGTISHAGRRRPATPAALVEVLAACARS